VTEKQFKSVYDTYVGSIRNYLYYRSGDPYLTDDLTQETFLRVWEKQFEFENPKKIKSLLYKIANELFLDWVRRHQLQTESLDQIKFYWHTNEANPIDAEIILEKCEMILAVLNENERVAFLLHKKDGVSQIEIAERMEVSIKTVERWMGSAKQKIKNQKNEKLQQRKLAF